MQTFRKISLVIALTLLFTGCQTFTPFKTRDMQDSLDKTLHTYELTVRWGELSQIYGFLEPELAKQTVMQENLEGIRVTSYEAIKRPTNTSENEIMQSVQIRYIYRDRQVEKTMVDHQQWTYNEGKKEWRRTNPIPRF